MTSAQERTLAQYQGLMQVNASSHILRAAREVGLIGELRDGQRTLQQLCETLSLNRQPLILLIDALMAIGIVEKYDEDHALSRAGHLLCQYDDDLGDQTWQRLVANLKAESGDSVEVDDRLQLNYLAATQWIHTASAMQAAEILDIGGKNEPKGLRILDLGCGSAVWSCAMAHRDPESTLTVVDIPAAIESAKSTAESIELTDRLTAITSDVGKIAVANGDEAENISLPAERFDLIITAQQLSCIDNESGQRMLQKAYAACAPGGRIVVVDLFRGPTKPALAESIEALKLELGTRRGRILSIDEIQGLMGQTGLQQIQFAFLAASRIGLGLAAGMKPIS